jgi:membrane protein YdbS with pleckstrin-like domain
MYVLCRDLALAVMRAPTRPPDPPAGAHDSVRVFRASRKYLTYKLLGFWLIFSANWLIPWGMVVAGLLEGERALVALGIVLMALLAVTQFCFYFAIRIDYDMRYYIVTDRSLRVREGAFIVKEKTISYANVQNLRVVQGPILRLFGIWHLNVDTAGGGASEQGQPGSNAHRVRVAGVENAHEVRDFIRGHLKTRAPSAGLGDLDDRDDDAPHGLGAGSGLLVALRELRSATSALRDSSENRA